MSVLTSTLSFLDNYGESDPDEHFLFNSGQDDNSTFLGNSTTPELPINMQFNSGHLMSIIIYSILLVLSATGNLTVFFMLLRKRRSRPMFSSMDLMLLHLSIADLMVTFLMMPLEISWSATVKWMGGDFMCRVMAFFRIFGLFLSSFVLTCMATDRYLAIKFPMQTLGGFRRSRYMIIASWILSLICSSPQIYVFNVERHPEYVWFEQCVTYSSLPTKIDQFAYFLFGMIFMYLGPLVIIVFSHCAIVVEVVKKNRESTRQMNSQGEGLRRSGMGNLGRAKYKALTMTIVICLMFILTWTPYHVMSLWFFIDEVSFHELDPRINKALFFFACTNSTVNPVVYGIFRLYGARSNNNNTVARNNNRGTMLGRFSGDLNRQPKINSSVSNNSVPVPEASQSLTVCTVKKTQVSILKRCDENNLPSKNDPNVNMQLFSSVGCCV